MCHQILGPNIKNALQSVMSINSSNVALKTFIFISQVLRLFPETLQSEICLHIHSELFKGNTAFRAATPSCKRSLAKKLKVQHYLPRQYVIRQGDEVDRVFFIIKGIVHILDPDEETVLGLGKK